MPVNDDSGDWGNVDASGDTEAYTEYLANATAVEAIAAYKARSHESLRLDTGDRVLDAGCGIGDDARDLAALVGPSGAVVGVDYSETMIAEAREHVDSGSPVSFEVGDVTSLQFDDNSFDAARADRVLQHLESPADALAELRRVTRPGGRVGLSDPDFDSLRMDAPGMDAHEDLLDSAYGPSRNVDMGRRLYRLAVEAGLEELEVDPVLFVATDFEFVRQMGTLDDWTENMVADGVFTRSDRDAWFDQLESASANGRFFAMAPFVTVTGTVPE